MNPLEPYRVGADGPWSRREAGHLLRRTGYCASEREIQAALSAGPEATVAQLVDDKPDDSRHEELNRLGETLAARGDIAALAAWWLMRMLHTQRPLRARMALFWHNHFATSNEKVGSPPLMLMQLRTFERHALGRFDALLAEATRGPAMIVWLDGDANRKDNPNENLAREVLELFSLGPGNYTENDIREAARALSGWQRRDGRFVFDRRLHDDGEKTVLGRRGRFGGDDIAALCAAHPACAPFIARKLLREFLNDRPDDATVEAFAAVLREEAWNLRASLRRLFTSRAFFDPANYRSRFKSPVEFCVGLLRGFEMSAPGAAIHDAASQMGQRLFEPPSVKGWEGGRRWINSAAMLVRMNTATRAAAGSDNFGLDAGRWASAAKLSDAVGAVDFACKVMLDGEPPEGLRSALHEKCIGAAAEAMRSAVGAIASSPPYQLA